MDNNEATSTVMLRITNIDPDNACKIMGYILIHDLDEKEMIRLALGTDTQLINLINQAKNSLGLSSNTSPTQQQTPFNHLLYRRPVFPQPNSPRITVPSNGFRVNNMNNNPSSPSFPWGSHMSPKPQRPVSYAAAVNGCNNNNNNNSENKYEFMDSHLLQQQLQHRRSVSENDVFLGGAHDDGEEEEEESNGGAGGSRPCVYFARGFCKNGSSCKFVHGWDLLDVGSAKFDGFEEWMRMKTIQHQRLAMAAAAGGGPFPYNRCGNFLNESPRSVAASALMMGEEFHKFGLYGPDRSDFSALGFGGNPNSTSRQIYLTFPAESTFKEEDVSSYFSTFGPVHDVRIPYQQKRMFGFVTFVYPETVKQILAKGNPHFVCDSRVLVKPYKEKGKVSDKKQQMERDFAACLSPTGLDDGEPYDLPFGRRIVYDSQEIMLRRTLEQEAKLHQAIEYQGRRQMNFQLRDVTNHLNHQLQPHMLAAAPFPSTAIPYPHMNQSLLFSSTGINEGSLKGSNVGKDDTISPKAGVNLKSQQETNESRNNSKKGNSSNDDAGSANHEDSDLNLSLDHILPDNLFASPTKSAADHQSLFDIFAEPDDSIQKTNKLVVQNNVPVLPTTSTLNNMASLKSCYFEMPREFE